MKKYKRPPIFVFFLLLISLFCVGKSSWISYYSGSFTLNSTPAVAVCKNVSTSTEYTDLGTGINNLKAKETLYVYNTLGSDYEIVIDQNCTIVKDATVLLPYSGTDTVLNRNNDGTGFADANSNSVKNNRKSYVVIKNNHTLTNNGTLTIGGVLGMTSGFMGATSGNYCEIAIEKGSKIINNGTLNCYGYIKKYGFDYVNSDKLDSNGILEDYQLICNSGSHTDIPFIYYHHRGGSIFKNAADNNECPFEFFDFPNLAIRSIFVKDSNLVGYFDIYARVLISTVHIANESPENAKLDIIKSGGGMFLINSGYIAFEYHPETFGYSRNVSGNDKTYTDGRIYGDVSINYLNKTILSFGIDTSKYYLPLSYRFKVSIYSGTCNITYKVKVMMGSSIVVKPGGILKIKANIAFYSNFDDYVQTTNFFQSNCYPNGYPAAYLENNGSVIVDSSASLVGQIISTSENAFLSYGSTNTTLEVPEGVYNTSSPYSYNYKGYTETAKIKYIYRTPTVGNDNSFDTELTDFELVNGGNIYYSTDTNNSTECGWSIGDSRAPKFTKYNIRYIVNNEYAINNNIRYIFRDDESQFELIPLDTSNKESGVFEGFYYDSSFNIKLESHILNPSTAAGYANGNNYINIYCKWISGVTFSTIYKNYTSSFEGDLIEQPAIRETVDISSVASTYDFNKNRKIQDNIFTYTSCGNDVQFGYRFAKIVSTTLVHKDGNNNIISQEELSYSNINSISSTPISAANVLDSFELIVNYEEEIKNYNLSLTGGTLAQGATQTYEIKDNGNAFILDESKTPFTFKWSIDNATGGDSNKLSIQAGATYQSCKIKNTNSGNRVQDETFTLSYTLSYENTTICYVSNDQLIYKSACVTFDTNILMADGSYKKAGDLNVGDCVMVFDHYSGAFSSSTIAFNDIDIDVEFNVVSLHFDNNEVIEIATEHGFFDCDLNKYIYITEYNYKDYYGHNFMTYKNGDVSYSKLISATVETRKTSLCSPGTARNLNIICGTFVTMPGGIDGLFNYLELDNYYKIDQVKMNEDIEKYGLFTYDEFKNYMSYDAFVAFNVAYAKISYGKGMLTGEMIYSLLERYKEFLN